MLAYLQGTIHTHTAAGAIVLVGPVGYECLGAWLTRLPLGDPVELYTYHYLENDNLPRLIAVPSLAARTLLIELLSVSGVGPKLAGRILDALTPERLVTAVTAGDLDTLSSVKGLGKKTAQKIILELGKTLVLDGTTNTPWNDALSSLGFSPSEISRAVKNTELAGLADSQALTALLRTLGGHP